MSSTPDELELNHFYKFLQTNLRETFEKAQDGCYVVCIPQSQSLMGVSFTQYFADYHLLKPSPYFQSQYMTSHSKGKTVTLENGLLITSDGFPTTNIIKVLSEELGYNKKFKPYRILVIERPLDPTIQNKLPLRKSAPEVTTHYSFADCNKWLRSHSYLEKALMKLDADIEKFMNSYMVLRDYLHDVSSRLQSICSSALERCVASNQHFESDNYLNDLVTTAIESYVMGKTHSKVYPVICKQFAPEDTALKRKLQLLKSLTGSELGLSPQFQCPLPTASQELQSLDTHRTPYEKLECLRMTLEYIKGDITAHHQAQTLGATPQEEMLFTSDDLIPIFVSLLCQCGCDHIVSNLFYMENFTWSLSAKDEFSFCLATLKASVEYSKDANIQSLRIRYCRMDEETGHGTRDAVTGRSIKTDPLGTSPQTSLTHIEKQLDKMARLLDQSSTSLSDRLLKNAGDGQSLGSTNDGKTPALGGFLSSLRDENDFGPTIGKK